MLRTGPIILLAISTSLAACGPQSDQETRDAAAKVALSELAINSAKRQCVNVAVFQQVPKEAAQDVRECTVTRLVTEGAFAPDRQPTDVEQQVALDACLDEYLTGDFDMGMR